jgi:hypothetical protein
MSRITYISYFLPITRAHLSGSVTTVTDTLIKENNKPVRKRAAADHSLTLVTVADQQNKRKIRLADGFWRDYSLDLGLTEDGRLITADATSTGQAGTVLAAGVTIAAAGAALAAGHLPLAAALAGLAAAVPRAKPDTAGPDDQGPLTGRPSRPAAAADPVWDAYLQQERERADRTARLLRQRADAEEALDQARDELRGAIADADKRHQYLEQVAALQALLVELNADLDELLKQFDAWRETTLIRSVEVLDELLPLDALPRLTAEGTLAFGADEPQRKAKDFWMKVGCVLATVGEPTGQAPEPARQSLDETLRFRRPRWIVLAQVKNDNGKAAVTRFDRVLIMDNRCQEIGLRLRKSRAAKRRTSVRLSSLGALTGISYGGTSSAAAATSAVGSAVGSAAADLSRDLAQADASRQPGGARRG